MRTLTCKYRDFNVSETTREVFLDLAENEIAELSKFVFNKFRKIAEQDNLVLVNFRFEIQASQLITYPVQQEKEKPITSEDIASSTRKFRGKKGKK